MNEPPAITIRPSQEVIDYRHAYTKALGQKKMRFDEEVYRFFMEQHPIPTESEREEAS